METTIKKWCIIFKCSFIVVGAGSTGSVVANRLSEKFRVLLLEAGGEPFPLQSVPAVAPVMLGNPTLDWNFYTVPQRYSCFALNNQVKINCPVLIDVMCALHAVI